MNINPTQSPIPAPYSSSVTKFTGKAVNAANASGSQTSAAASDNQASSADVEKIKEKVKLLMAQSDVRPEVVQDRKASDPVNSYTDAQVSRLVAGLKNEE